MSNRRRLTLVGALIALVMAVGVGAYALGTVTFAKGVKAVKVKTETASFATGATDWVDLPGAKFSLKVPANQTATFVAFFSAESYCDENDSGYCSVRILMDGAEMNPAAGTDFAFDTDGAGTDWWESHAMQRVVADVGPGTHQFKVQMTTTQAGTLFRLDDWTLTVMRAAQ